MTKSANTSLPTTLVIFGITGDLSLRKLLPALRAIAKAGHLPKAFSLVGVSRRHISAGEVLQPQDILAPHLRLVTMDLTNPKEYQHLTASLQTTGQHLFYLSVPPQVAEPIIEGLGQTSLAKAPTTKLLLEKPFGVDLESAEELIESISKHFREEQVYRIDHYLAKEMVQNLLVFRASNSLFRRTWNNQFIERIDIRATEKIGIEGRAAFYEQTGALRDIVQSHLLQLAALVLMELPEHENWSEVPAKRQAALESIMPPVDIARDTLRAQYKGYGKEVQNGDSTTETFVHLTLFTRDPRFEHVPIHLTTGKALDQKLTEICITYKQDNIHEANMLSFRIQPEERVAVHLLTKKPGYDHATEEVALSFPYHTHFSDLPEAYEQVFVDAMRGNHTLFTTGEEVLASWRIMEPIQKAWELQASDLKQYQPGSTPDSVIATLGFQPRG